MAKERVIPINHAEGQAVAGEIIKTRNLIEGIILGGIPFVAVLYFCRSLTFADKVTIAIIVALPMLYLGINGINGDSFTTFKFLSSSFREITSPILTLYDGISTFLPLTVT